MKYLHSVLLLFAAAGLMNFTAFCQSKPAQNKTTASATQPKKQSAELATNVTAVYPVKNTPGEFEVDLQVVKGKVKPGDKVDMISPSGERFSFTVKKLRDPFGDIAEADNTKGTVYLTVSGSGNAAINKSFVLVNTGGTATAANPGGKSSDELNAVLGGKPWKGFGFSNSHLFYTKGIRQINNGKPVLMLAFKAANAPDDRQLTIMITTGTASPGMYKGENIELLLSGSPTGDTKNPEMFGYKYPETVTSNLSIEITAYKDNGNGTAAVSGKITGNLKPVLMSGKQELQIQNCVFENITVKVFNEKY